MWIQARKDPDKQWLQMRYCITEGDIDMVINEWDDEWKTPSPYPGIVGKNNRRRGRAGRDPTKGNSSAQEMKNGPGKNNTDR
jgi:hypothetical protein